MDFIRNQAEKLIHSRKLHNRWIQVFICLAIILIMILEPVLGKIGIALTHKKRILECPHTGEMLAHMHNDDCYDADGNLVCTLPEQEIHEHTDLCYTWTRELTCGMEESEEHTHTEDCYTLVRGDLVCGKEEAAETHIHGAECFRTVEVEVPEEEELLQKRLRILRLAKPITA